MTKDVVLSISHVVSCQTSFFVSTMKHTTENTNNYASRVFGNHCFVRIISAHFVLGIPLHLAWFRFDRTNDMLQRLLMGNTCFTVTKMTDGCCSLLRDFSLTHEELHMVGELVNND